MRILAFLLATLLAAFVTVQADAQQGYYWNGAPYGAGQYPWEQGGGWNNNGNWGGWNDRHSNNNWYGHPYSHRNPPTSTGSGNSGGPSGNSGGSVVGAPGNVR
ncbi:MAG TPA: hypothetical protein VFB13_12885 [Reyranella sp.]|jgi:hypothetical protein|nr:hypothetical protein [Reyranella sp.]